MWVWKGGCGVKTLWVVNNTRKELWVLLTLTWCHISYQSVPVSVQFSSVVYSVILLIIWYKQLVMHGWSCTIMKCLFDLFSVLRSCLKVSFMSDLMEAVSHLHVISLLINLLIVCAHIRRSTRFRATWENPVYLYSAGGDNYLEQKWPADEGCS